MKTKRKIPAANVYVVQILDIESLCYGIKDTQVFRTRNRARTYAKEQADMFINNGYVEEDVSKDEDDRWRLVSNSGDTIIITVDWFDVQ